MYKSSAPLPTISILGIPIHRATVKNVFHCIDAFMTESKLHQIATANPEFVMRAQNDGLFNEVLQNVDLCLADGIGLVLASHLLRSPVPERIAGSDLVYSLAERCAQKGWRLFLLGAASGVADEAAARLRERYPHLIIAGTYAGSPDPAENGVIVELVNRANADVLYVAYGAPQQDLWIARNRETLRTVRVAIGVGGALDFITGRAIRAPRWMQRVGLEWFHRLWMEPWRWRRMLALPQFVFRVIVSVWQDK